VGRPLLIAVLALGALGLTSVPARAAGPAWLPDAPAALDAASESVAVDAAGDTFIAYQVNGNLEIDLVERPAGGSFGAPQKLSETGALAGEPSIAVDAAGDAVIAWKQVSLVKSEVVYNPAAATRSASGVVSTLGVLDSTGVKSMPISPKVAENATGAAVIAWVPSSTDAIEAVTRGAAGEAFGSETGDLGEAAAPISHMSDAVDSAGNDVLAFEGAGQAWVLSGREGSWNTSAQQVSNGAAKLTGRVGLAVAGTEVLLAWSQGEPGEVFASRGTIAGGLTLPVDLSDASQSSVEPSVATDPAGDALVAWQAPPAVGSISDIRASVSLAGASFPLPTQTAKLAEVTDFGGYTTSAMGPTGQAIVTWTRPAAGNEIAEGTSWTPAGGFTPVKTLSASGEEDLLFQSDAADPLGDDLATWLSHSGTIEVAVYDAAPPSLGTATIPASATVGVPASFSAANPLDVWSPPVTVSWSFGDGSSATGEAVTHIYAHAGNFPVTLTATDALGNATSQSGSVTVAASTSAPGGAASGSGTSGAATGGNGTSDGTLTVTDLKLSPTRFHRGTRAATIAAARTKRKAKALPTATTISFQLSQAATVALGFEKAHTGVLVGHKCAAATKTHHGGKRCTFYTAVHGSVSIAAPASADRVGFDGVLDGGAKLPPGSYRLLLGASDATGTTTAAQRPAFTLVG
jgi:hypothetical protein